MYYHETKEAALLAGTPHADLFHVRVELEPYNGWVLVLKPKDLRAFAEPLYDYVTFCEVDLSGFPMLRQRPASYRKAPPAPLPPAKPAKPEPEDDIAPTWTPGDALPW